MAWADTGAKLFTDAVGYGVPFILRRAVTGDTIQTTQGPARINTLTVAPNTDAPGEVVTIIGQQITTVIESLEPVDLPAECIITHGPHPTSPDKTLKRLMRVSTYEAEQSAPSAAAPGSYHK
jgi:hypothetical protein